MIHVLAVHPVLGNFSINKSDGSENVIQKVNSYCVKLLRAYSITFNLSNVGKFFWN